MGPQVSDRRRFVHDISSPEGPFPKLELWREGSRLLSPFDGHIHTTESDATQSPRSRALEIKQANGMTVVITDHYTPYGGVYTASEYERLTQGQGSSKVIAGLEVGAQANIDGFSKPLSMHVLGVAIKPEDPTLKEWLRLNSMGFKGNILDYISVRDELVGQGFDINEEQREKVEPKKLVDQVHLGGHPQKRISGIKYLVDQLTKSDENLSLISDRLGIQTSEGGRPIRQKIIKRQLYNHFKTRFGTDLPGKNPELREVADLMHQAGGLLVVAHIGTSISGIDDMTAAQLEPIFKQFKQMGADAIEAYTPKHKIETGDRIAEAGLKAGLLITAGSDSHTKDRLLGTVGYDDPAPGFTENLSLM